MPDRAKVIKAFECCDDEGSPNCEQCPYMDDDFVGTCASRNPLFRDALALLKEQEPVKPAPGMLCGQCGCRIYRDANYCYNCGRELDWNA